MDKCGHLDASSFLVGRLSPPAVSPPAMQCRSPDTALLYAALCRAPQVFFASTARPSVSASLAAGQEPGAPVSFQDTVHLGRSQPALGQRAEMPGCISIDTALVIQFFSSCAAVWSSCCQEWKQGAATIYFGVELEGARQLLQFLARRRPGPRACVHDACLSTAASRYVPWPLR